MADVPRRNRVDQWSPAERAIQAAVDAVEGMGADVRLTDVVVLLGAARESVADYVDEIMCRRSVQVGDPSPSATPRHTSQQLAQQREQCADYQRFLRKKGTASKNLRDATTYAEIAAVVDEYLRALEELHR